VRILLTIVGVLLIISGCVWILQGINVLPGSFMTGQSKWTINGAIALVIGLVFVYLGRRKTV
jgi:hypothetical protein